jgi:Fe-S-cluster containining protein
MGYCKRCGTCCQWVYVTFPWKVTLRRLDELRGMEKVDDYTIRSPIHCKLYDIELHLCGDYEHRPIDCKVWPMPNERYIPIECKYNEEDKNETKEESGDSAGS